MIELTNPAGYGYCHKILPFLATRSKSRSVPHVAYSIFPTSLLPTSYGWTFQSCAGNAWSFCTTGKDDMFYDDPFSWDKLSDFCYKTYKVRTRPDMEAVTFGTDHLQAASNIVFSNGDKDPWSAAGVKEDINEKVIAVWVKDGYHGSDLDFPPINQSAEKAQEIERQHIRKWIEEAREICNN